MFISRNFVLICIAIFLVLDGVSADVQPCSAAGFRRDESDCAKFYRCTNDDGQGFKEKEYNCPKKFGFDLKTKACDWPYIAKCPGF